MIKTMFDPAQQGTHMYICGCGWAGTEPQYTLIPHSWREPTCFKVSSAGKRPTEYQTYTHNGDMNAPFGYECPKCGANLKEDSMLILDVGGGVRNTTKRWKGSGKEYVKALRTDLPELRLASSPRNLSAYVAEKGSSAILWEIIRTLGIELPKKPVFAEFKSKDGFFAALKKYKASWKQVFNSEHSIADMLNGKKRSLEDKEAKAQAKAVLVALGINLKSVKMSSKFKFVSMASKLADKRKEAAIKAVNRVMKRTSLSVALERATAKGLDDVSNILTKLMDEFGDIYIRIDALRFIFKNRWDMFAVTQARTRAFEKDTWKYGEFKKEHPEFWTCDTLNGRDVFEDAPEFSLMRGKPTVMDDGSATMYSPEEDCVVCVGGPDSNIHHVAYLEIDKDVEDLDNEPLAQDEPLVNDVSEEEEEGDETPLAQDWGDVRTYGRLGTYHEWKLIEDEVFINNRMYGPVVDEESKIA